MNKSDERLFKILYFMTLPIHLLIAPYLTVMTLILLVKEKRK